MPGSIRAPEQSAHTAMTKAHSPVPEDPSVGGKLMLRGKRIASKRSVKHLMAAVTRYGDRLGSQFAGAMTYFSFLSLVPILMVGFAIGGIVLRQQPGVADRTGEPGRRGTPRRARSAHHRADRQRRGQSAGRRHRRSADRVVFRHRLDGQPAQGDEGDLAAGVRRGQGHRRQLRRRDPEGSGVAGRPRGGDRRFVGTERVRLAVRRPGPGSPGVRRPGMARAGDHHRDAADRHGGRRVDLHVGVHDAPRQGAAVDLQGAVARLDHRRRRVRDPQVRVDRSAAQCRLDVENCGHLRPGDRVAVLLQPGRPAGVVRRRLDRHRRGRTGTGTRASCRRYPRPP